MSVLDKKMKTPRKTQKNNLKNTIYQNVNWRGPAFTLSLPGEKVALCPLSVKPLTLMCVWLSFQTKEALFAALKLTFYEIINDFSIGDISFCFRFNEGTRALLGLLTEAFSYVKP